MRLLQPNRLLRRVLVSTAALVLKVGTVRMVLLAITALAMVSAWWSRLWEPLK
jgi:hypothetical protein